MDSDTSFYWCWEEIEATWNKYGGARIEFIYGGGRLDSDIRVYSFEVGNREIICYWDGKTATLNQYPSWYRSPGPNKNNT